MDTRLQRANNQMCAQQWRQAAQPETRLFGLSMSKFKRIDNLVRRPDMRRYCAYWIFESDARDRSIHQHLHERQRLALLLLLLRPPARARHGQILTWRMRYHQIPAISQNLAYIALQVLSWLLRWKHITRPGIMSA